MSEQPSVFSKPLSRNDNQAEQLLFLEMLKTTEKLPQEHSFQDKLLNRGVHG